MVLLARLYSLWASGWAPCLDSLLAVLHSLVRSLAGIPDEAELPTIVCVRAGLEAVLHGQAGLLSRALECVGVKAVLHNWAVQLAGLCAQQLRSALDSGSKAASGHWAPLQMGVEVMLCSWAGLLVWLCLRRAVGWAPQLPRLACRAGPEAMSSSCLGGVVEWALPLGQPAGCAPKLGRTANRAP